MDFQKKLKRRLYIAVFYIVLGLIFIVSAFLSSYDNYFISSYGIALIVMGIMRIIRYRKITADEKNVRRQELAETDERNRMIAERARSWTFSFSVMVAGLAVIILSVLGKHDQALPFAWFVCLMIVLYWIFWNVIRMKY